MSYNSIHKCLIDNKLWGVISVLLLGWYLSPLFYHTFYVPIFDNLDSNVVWYKILAESGKIFAPNNAIIPNMMGGLPRSSYGSEFNLILWLYYFFKPQTAYIINEVLIHLIAFFSMFLFLRKYVVAPSNYYGNVPTFLGAITFALLPFWSGAGASIALLPLVTYSLLNIKSGKDNKWDWIILILLPFYSSLVFLYVFYLLIAGIYFLYDSIKHRKINKKFLIALLLMGTMFLLSEYRLVYTMFFDKGFVSHRTEFDIFFQEDLWECYRRALVDFLIGHIPHAQSLQQKYILPLIISAALLLLVRHRLNAKESLVIWLLIIASFFANIWNTILINRYLLPVLALYSLYIILRKQKYRIFGYLLLLMIVLCLLAGSFEYKGFAYITTIIPLLKGFNIIRLFFVEPLIMISLLAIAFVIFFRKLHFTIFAIFVFLTFQATYSISKSFYQTSPQSGYASFTQYYAPSLFKKMKQDLSFKKNLDVVGYGIEPAILLFNGFYTVDGYSTNYPLEYKHRFGKVILKYKHSQLYEKWGSKVYILTVPNQLGTYLSIKHKKIKITSLRFDNQALCNLSTDYLVTPYHLKTPQDRNLTLMHYYKGQPDSWDIYLYKLHCSP